MSISSKINVALVDDHSMFRGGVKSLLESEDNIVVTAEASSGEELLERLKTAEEPHLLLCDIKMDGMSGHEVAAAITKTYPNVKILALSMYMDESSIIRMIKNGAKGYLLKGAEPWELILAVNTMFKEGFYWSSIVNQAMFNEISDQNRFELDTAEKEFLLSLCSERSYKEIAESMNLSVRTVDGYREKLFKKIQVKTRVGAVLYAFKHDIYKIDS